MTKVTSMRPKQHQHEYKVQVQQRIGISQNKVATPYNIKPIIVQG